MVKVSIVVPVFNVEKYARFCFDSLISQSLEDIEIILVDDGATDSSGSICEEYAAKDARVKVVHQTNRGVGLSRNRGLEIATGKYIGFVDSDDCISKEMFKVLFENAEKYVSDITYCAYKRFSLESEVVDNEIQPFPKVSQWKGQKEIRQYMLDRIGLLPQCRNDNLYGASVCYGIFSRKLLADLNVGFVSERQFISEDMLFDIDVIPHCNKIVHCDIELYYYRYNPHSLTTVYKPDRFEKNLHLYHEMYKKLKRIYSDKELFDSMSRYLLTITRIAVIQEAKFVDRNSKAKAKKNIIKICSHKELRDILSKYRYWRLPWKYAIYCWLEKNKMAGLLLFLTTQYYR